MLRKKISGLSLYLFALVSTSYAGPVAQYLQHYQEQKNRLTTEKTIIQRYFNQTIDHQNPATGTFPQRYYLDESFSTKTTDPVFFYICGEAACSEGALYGAIRDYAKKYHAKLVALEHRYYGESLPFNSFSTYNLRYLTTKTALEDLAYFQQQITEERQWKGAWIAFGGSYPGSLSAYYRLHYPNLVAGALASSAPVMAKEDFFEYDAHVNQVVGPKCAQQMREVTSILESALKDEAQLKQLKELFSATEVIDPIDFLYLVADTGAAAVQYGKKDKFCSSLATSPTPLQGYAEFAQNLYQEMEVSAVEMTAQGALSESPSDYKNGVGMRQWFYQSCAEYGYWQNANPDSSQATRSSLINLDYHHQICARLFGITKPADTAYINNNFYYPLQDSSASRIYFTNGENDPWSVLSLADKNSNTSNPNLQYYLITNAAHCDDLHRVSSSDSSSLKLARQKLTKLLDEWLRQG